MLDIRTMVNETMMRAHRTLCTEPENCTGPTEIELMITGLMLESTLPTILKAISLEFKQVLHSMAAGHTGEMGPPDATSLDAEDLITQWFRWWRDDTGLRGLPQEIPARTAAYLTALAARDGRRIRSVADL